MYYGQICLAWPPAHQLCLSPWLSYPRFSLSLVGLVTLRIWLWEHLSFKYSIIWLKEACSRALFRSASCSLRETRSRTAEICHWSLSANSAEPIWQKPNSDAVSGLAIALLGNWSWNFYLGWRTGCKFGQITHKTFQRRGQAHGRRPRGSWSSVELVGGMAACQPRAS